MQEIRAWFAGPLVLSGAIATGGAILAAQAMGADLAYIGSAFIATAEANADADYKRMIVDGTAADIAYTSAISGVARQLPRPSLARAGLDPDNAARAAPAQMDFSGGSARGLEGHLERRPGYRRDQRRGARRRAHRRPTSAREWR